MADVEKNFRLLRSEERKRQAISNNADLQNNLRSFSVYRPDLKLFCEAVNYLGG